VTKQFCRVGSGGENWVLGLGFAVRLRLGRVRGQMCALVIFGERGRCLGGQMCQFSSMTTTTADVRATDISPSHMLAHTRLRRHARRAARNDEMDRSADCRSDY